MSTDLQPDNQREALPAVRSSALLADYPSDWPDIARRIKSASDWKCERCKHPHAIGALGDEYSGRLRKEEWEVRPVEIAVARELVETYHYAKGASNTRTYLHGLFKRGAKPAQTERRLW